MNWLPEDYTLKLNALQLGALLAVLDNARKKPSFPTAKPDENGEPIEVDMVELLYEKVFAILREGI